MLVCLCYPASEQKIDSVIDDGAHSVEEIGRRCGAGTGCGSCREELRDRLAAKGCCGGAPRDTVPAK